jgi:magnesium-dependent phosphatase 1
MRKRHNFILKTTRLTDERFQLRQMKIKIAAASRTDAPELAREMLKLLKAPEQPTQDPSSKATSQMTKAIEFFDQMQIFPGSKIGHMEKIRAATGIKYEEMLFFDDESRNRDVERLGVVMWLVRDGLTNDEVDMGVLSWRKRNKRQLE